MRAITMKRTINTRLILAPMVVVACTAAAYAAAPGITGSSGATGPATFNLTAQAAFITQPDGYAIYSFGYGCSRHARLHQH